MGLQTCLISYTNKTEDVSYLKFLIVSPVSSCKQDRGLKFDNNIVKGGQDLLWNEPQRTIVNDCQDGKASAPVGCPGTTLCSLQQPAAKARSVH